jgi:hypothetical protein
MPRMSKANKRLAEEFAAAAKEAPAAQPETPKFTPGEWHKRMREAAPEMYQALKDIQHNAQVMNNAEPNRVWMAIDDICRAVLAKVEGKQP